MKRKGQALVEALAVLGLCLFFFSAWFKLLTGFLAEIKTEELRNQSQICRLSGKFGCDSGFVLVTMLLYSVLIVFAGQLLLSLIVAGSFRWKALDLCFGESLLGLTAQPPSLIEKLKELENEANKLTRGILKIESRASEPIVNSGKNTKQIYYKIDWMQSFTPALFSFNSGPLNETYTCGVQRICDDKKCLYRLIADK